MQFTLNSVVFIKQNRRKIVPRLVLELAVRVRPIYGIYLVKKKTKTPYTRVRGGGGEGAGIP